MHTTMAVVSIAAVAGCSAPVREDASSDRQIHVVERDFSIAVDAPSVVPSGALELAIDNQGPERHELIVVRSDRTKLPLRSDGITVDEDALESQIVGTHEAAVSGSHGSLSLQLSPGHYVLFCNMAGHYLGGMHADLVVQS